VSSSSTTELKAYRSGVFLSHSHNDKEFARKLGRDLRGLGFPVWIDDAEIRLGDSLIQKISEGIRAMEYLAVLLSRASIASEWVQREVEIAMTHEIQGQRVKVLPILLEDCDIPSFLIGKMYADFRTPEKYEQSFQLILSRFTESNVGDEEWTKKEALRSVLRSMVLPWKSHGILIQPSQLQVLAKDRIQIEAPEVDMVFDSIVAYAVPEWKWISDWWEYHSGGPDPMDPELVETAPRERALNEVVDWAKCCGLRSRIDEIYAAINKDL
jgi:hypothetical protein